MKIPLIILSLGLGATALAASPGATDHEAVLAAERAACRAYQESDAAALETLLAEGYTLTNSRGEVAARAEDIAEVRGGSVHYTIFENRDMQVRLYGDAAVVTGKTFLQGTVAGKPVAATFQFTDTLIRRAGRWLLAASHATRIDAH